MPTVETNSVETYYERTGEGQPVVFVHGATSDCQLWQPVVDRLADAYTCITYDVRGHGRTGGSAVDAYSVELFADDLAALIDTLELESVAVCGLSLGGMIAQTYAARRPDPLAGVVVADAPTPEVFGLGERLQRSVLFRAIVPPIRLIGYERIMSGMEWLQERLYGEESLGNTDEIDRIRDEELELETDEFAKVMRAAAGFTETSLDLEVVDVPALALYGEHEPAMMERHADAFARQLHDARVEKIPDAGHNSHVDNPDYFADAVREFLAGLDWASPQTA